MSRFPARVFLGLWFTAVFAAVCIASGAPPVDADGRPLIQKLGTVDVDKVENSPVVFRGKLYRFEWLRGAGCFHFVDCRTGLTTPQFAKGWCFGNAFVEGDTVYVTGTRQGKQVQKVQMWSSRDLEHWDTWTALDLPGFSIFNTSICKTGDRFVMMFEIDKPRKQAGAPFTARFATSKDLKQWTVTPSECAYAKDRYTAPHCLRYLDGYYYDFYLESIRGGYEQFVVRSKDLIHWESSPLNPVLRASDDDRKIRNPNLTPQQRKRIATAKNINNSDIDFCEYQGRLVIFYSWGSQLGVEHLAEAVYEGTQADFLRGWFPTAVAGPQITHDSDKKLVTMANAENHLVLRLNYDGRCMLDRVVVRGEEVISPAMGVCSSIRLGTAEYTTRSGLKSPKVAVAKDTVTVSEIRFGGSGVNVEETWSFTVRADRIVWRIARKYLTGGTLDDTGFPGWDFSGPSTWTGALLGTGGVAWFRLFDTPTATYGVHTGPVTFWNRDNGVCLRIMPTVPEGRHTAVCFSRQPRGVLSFNYCVTNRELATRHGHCRFLRDKQDVWAPFKVVPGETTVEYTLSGLDYAEAYDRGVFVGIDGAAVREICNTIARLGVIDARIMGSNGWYSGYAVLHEHWIAQLGLAIDDPHYFRSYAETLDYQRDHAVGPDGRVKSRWAYGPWDAVPGTYDSLGFYECQWGWLMDSQPSFVVNVAEQFDFNGDLEWVRGHKSTCERVLEYMLRRDSNGNGLVEMMTDNHTDGKGSDWLDVVWASFENGLVNAEMYYALGLWADVEELLGDRVRATKYRRCAAKLKDSFNRSTADGGLWDPVRKCYAHWRDKDGSIHGTNLVTPVNFMAVAYGICDDPARRAAVLDRIEDQMRKEKLFIWPLCMFSYTQEEGGGWPFPNYENGDIFLGWAEVGTRAYARHNPAIAVRCVKNVLDKYVEDGLAFQRYLRRSQTGLDGDILACNANPVVGLYRNIYGVQPKWNRLYLEPHLTPELNGTRLKYWLRDQWYAINLDTRRCRIAVNDFSVSDTKPFAVNAKGDTLEYFHGDRKTFSMAVTRSVPAPLELRIDAWPSTAGGLRKWTETAAQDSMTVRHVVSDLVPGAEYTLFRNGARVTTVRSDAAGNIAFEVASSDSQPQTYELKR